MENKFFKHVHPKTGVVKYVWVIAPNHTISIERFDMGLNRFETTVRVYKCNEGEDAILMEDVGGMETVVADEFMKYWNEWRTEAEIA